MSVSTTFICRGPAVFGHAGEERQGALRGDDSPKVRGQCGSQLDLPGQQTVDVKCEFVVWNDYNL